MKWRLKLSLEKTGFYEVDVETDAREAVATVRRVRPDLILLDVIMEHVDGGTVADRLQKDHEVRQIPLIFLTASLSPKEQPVGGLESGGFQFLAKPVSLKALVQCIEAHLPSFGQRSESTASIRPV